MYFVRWFEGKGQFQQGETWNITAHPPPPAFSLSYTYLMPYIKKLNKPHTYLQVLGVAVLSMCFQLMQDELIAKLKWLGEKLGIGKKNDKNTGNEEKTTSDNSKDDPKKK